MASPKYFLLCPFLFLSLSSSFANRVLNYHVGDQNLPQDKQLPVTDNGSGFGSGSGLGSGVGAGNGAVGGGSNAGRGVDPIVNGFGVGVGVGVGYRPGYGPPGGYGHWTGPGIGGPGPNSECILGYVCPANGRRGCNNFPYGTCESYGFYPLTSMDLHEVEINWAKSKPVPPAQPGEFEPAPRQSPPITIDDDQPTKAQNGV